MMGLLEKIGFMAGLDDETFKRLAEKEEYAPEGHNTSEIPCTCIIDENQTELLLGEMPAY